MKQQYLNNLIEDSYSLFTRMKSGVRTAGLVALVGAIIVEPSEAFLSDRMTSLSLWERLFIS